MSVRWGFLGAGWIASRALAPAVHRARGAVLAAAAARDPDRARALGPARVHRDYADLLDDPALDAVYISLANDDHCRWVLAALAAGKHVLCEKPLGLTAGEVDAMAAAARRAGRLLVEASWYRWHPRTRRAAELLAAAAVGRVRQVDAGFSFSGVAPGNYRLDPARGGGAAYDVGCYAVSAALWALGPGPWQVRAWSRLGPTGVDLDTDIALEGPDGTSARLRASVDGPERQWLRVIGEAGEVELVAPSFTAYQAPCALRVRRAVAAGQGPVTEQEVFPAVDPYQLMVEETSSAAAGGPGWVVPLGESRAGAAVLDAARASASAGARPVTCPGAGGLAGGAG